MVVDHPFFFAITEGPDAILFAGVITDPTQH
jgi:serine protease inhibitor